MRRLGLLLVLVAASAHAQLEQRITVARILIDARVTSEVGAPIAGLKSDDFRVTIDGKPAKVESVDWIEETTTQDHPRSAAQQTAAQQAASPSGRLLVFFFQTDFARATPRIRGQMYLVAMRDKWIQWLQPSDRVAVFSFDSHLKFRLDFTNDKRRIRDAMEQALYIDEPPPQQPGPEPSLTKRLSSEELKNARTSEDALLIIGRALEGISGPKSLVLFGWGLGHYVGRLGVYMDAKYPWIRYQFDRSRVTVFSIDFTQAESHSLAAGMNTVSKDTGGFYASTNSSPTLAIEQLERTLSGYYELEVRRPESTRAGSVHSIEIAVPSHRFANVLAPTAYVDTE